MKFCSRLTCPVTSVSAVTPSHWTLTSFCFDAAHWAPVLTWFQKSKPTAFGTTARRRGPDFFSVPPLPPPPPPDSWTDPQPATTTASTLARTTMPRIRMTTSRCRSLPGAAQPAAPVLVEDHGQPDDH